MKSFSFENITVTGDVEFKQILYFNMQAEVNHHALLSVYGLIDYNDEKTAAIYGKELRLICNTKHGQEILFSGTVQSLNVHFRGEECYADITGISSSHELDREKKKRSFQNTNMTYKQLLDTVSGEGGCISFPGNQYNIIGDPMIQYDETDWDFCKRIAGRFCTFVIPEISRRQPQLTIGLSAGRHHILNEHGSYRQFFDAEEYRKKRQVCDCNAKDFITYSVFSKDNYALGDKVHFLDQQMFVLKKQVYLDNSAVEMEYTLGSPYEKGEFPYQNPHIGGKTISGIVKWRDKETLKVHLDIDQEKNLSIEGLYAFNYMPVSGNLLYAIPELETRVRLYFPDGDEKNGIVIDSIGGDDNYPEAYIKVFEMYEHKKMKLSPEEFLCKSENGEMEIALSDQEGVKVYSNKNISLQAKGKIRINARGTITGENPQGFYFNALGSGDYIDISGNKMVLKTDKATVSALPHKLGKKPKLPAYSIKSKDARIYVDGVLGGIPQGIAKNQVSLLVIGGIPKCTDPYRTHTISDMIFLGRK